jgi:hypothetical protein
MAADVLLERICGRQLRRGLPWMDVDVYGKHLETPSVQVFQGIIGPSRLEWIAKSNGETVSDGEARDEG